MDYKDYYATLGIPSDADEQAIRTAFRRLARVHHPDVAVEKDGATERFKEINEAYTVLSDPDKRRTYDVFRTRYERYQTAYSGPRTETARPSSAGAREARPGPAPSGAPRTPPRTSATDRAEPRRTQTRTINEDDFERLFRGFVWAYTATTARNSGRSGSTASSDFSDFFEALFGNLRNSPGAGRAADPVEPSVRPGRDIEVAAQLTLEEAFRGTTRTLTYGDGRKVEVTIPPGVDTGSRLRVRGQGERMMGRSLGDLYMTIDVQPHAVFARDGNDLKIRVSIPHDMAVKSGEVQIPTLDRSVQLRIPAGARSGQSLRLRGQGMPTIANPAVRGDLIALVEVQAPPNAQARPAGAPPTPNRRARSAKPQPQPARASARAQRAQSTSGIRQALGLAVTALSLLVLTAQGLMAPANGWLWVAAIAVVFFVYGLVGRAIWAAGIGLLAAAGCVWLVTQVDIGTAEALRQAWPLLPAALGVALLSFNPRQR